MISEYFVKRFGLTKEGSDNLIKGIIYTALLNIAFMFPVGLYALLIYMWVGPLTGGEIIEQKPDNVETDINNDEV